MNRKSSSAAEKIYVYCSGPLFCPEELGGMTALAKVLETAGYGTFLPHRDGLEAHLMKFVNTPLGLNIFKSRDITDRLIFSLDVYQIVERCRCFVMNMNGRVPDEGAVAETAMAFMAGKPVVLYKNDCRTVFSGRDNSMITGLACLPLVSKLSDLPRALERASGKIKPFPAGSSREEILPDKVGRTVMLGRRVWRVMSLIQSGQGHAKQTSALIDEISHICAQETDFCKN